MFAAKTKQHKANAVYRIGSRPALIA
jgi:hypothetical protein